MAATRRVTVGFQGLEHEITIDQGHLLLGRRRDGRLPSICYRLLTAK